MSYAKVEDGEIVAFGLPETSELSDGSQVSGFDKLPEEDLKTEGWLPIEEKDPPEHDPNTQEAKASDWVVEDDKITRTWEVVDRVAPTPDAAAKPSFDDRLDALEADVKALKEQLAAKDKPPA